MPENTHGTSMGPRRITSLALAFAFAVAGMFMLLFGAFVQYWYNVRNPGVACFELERSPDAAQHSSLTLWPVGVRCEYASGPEPIVIQSDWTLTFVLLAGVSLVLTALAMWRLSAR